MIGGSERAVRKGARGGGQGLRSGGLASDGGNDLSPGMSIRRRPRVIGVQPWALTLRMRELARLRSPCLHLHLEGSRLQLKDHEMLIKTVGHCISE